MVVGLVVAAVVLAGVDLVQARGRSLLAWAVVLLACALLVPVLPVR